ncbi:hypothetical protein BpHYR1_004474 [Brachionus plicatilis]|uniref:Uncharacterized protein n=1 Tax=Brachionus plicatilis TaxID=10195 RepID=A0A3M7S9J7_BRAPC|nr:hypothetical protein BpHYR1_004474 [Brachionus plicatilis]
MGVNAHIPLKSLSLKPKVIQKATNIIADRYQNCRENKLTKNPVNIPVKLSNKSKSAVKECPRIRDIMIIEDQIFAAN